MKNYRRPLEKTNKQKKKKAKRGTNLQLYRTTPNIININYNSDSSCTVTHREKGREKENKRENKEILRGASAGKVCLCCAHDARYLKRNIKNTENSLDGRTTRCLMLI